jgi:SAM-dependent methyltransferase
MPGARDAYNAWHEHYEVDRDAAAPWHRLVVRHLDADRDLKDRRVLEIACGRGGFAARLAHMSDPPPRLVAADFSAAAVRKARAFTGQEAPGHVACEVGDAQSLPHPDASFDTVISCETLEHLPDPRSALAEFARVLKNRGRLVLTTPNYLGPMGLYRGYLRLRGRRYSEEGQPINNFLMLPRTALWVRAAGMKVVTVEASGHYVPVPGRPPVELAAAAGVRPLRWLALHSLLIAEKRG